jgi:hypothetical protein
MPFVSLLTAYSTSNCEVALIRISRLAFVHVDSPLRLLEWL